MRRILIVLVGLMVAVVTSATAVQASLTDKFRFADHGKFVDEICGGIPVRIEFSEHGSGVGRVVGPRRELRYTVTHRGEAVYRNLDTGRTFTFFWRYLDQDKRVTIRKNGTLSILGISPGTELVRGPEGELLDVKAGLFRWVLIVDHGGTPRDPSDDSFVTIRFLSGPEVYTDFCDDFRALTS